MNCYRDSFITVVSGLPRAGTSMMMQMLAAGGLTALTDATRGADEDNLKGYYELEAVKRTKSDNSWVRGAVGKAVKVIYMLLKDLPADYEYRLVFMRRNVDEIVRSQQAMLARRGEKGAKIPAKQMAATFQRELDRCDQWLTRQPGFAVLDVEHRAVIDDPRGQARRICGFLGQSLDIDAMAAAVDPELYRQRSE